MLNQLIYNVSIYILYSTSCYHNSVQCSNNLVTHWLVIPI